MRTPLRISDLRNKPLWRESRAERSPAGQCCDTFATLRCVCVPTYMRNTYPGVGSVLRTIIACRPEDSLRPVLSYPSSSLAIVPRQTHDHNPSFPFCRRVSLFLSLPLSTSLFSVRVSTSLLVSPQPISALSLFHPYRFSLFLRRSHLSEAPPAPSGPPLSFSSPAKTLALRLTATT